MQDIMETSARFSGISAFIQEELLKAKTTIQVAVAWFTDQSIYRVLLQKAHEGVRVSVLIRHDAINFNALDNKKLDWQQLVGAGGQLFCSPDQPALHHKFCIIDGGRVLSGSYNWTYAARRNRENVIACEIPEVVQEFSQNYASLLSEARTIIKIPSLIPDAPSVEGNKLEAEAELELSLRNDIVDDAATEAEYMQLVAEADGAYCSKAYEEAMERAKRAISMKPSRIEAYCVLGSVYWRTEQLKPFLSLATEVESIVADAIPWQRAYFMNLTGLVMDNLAMIDKQKGNEPEAKKKFREAVDYFDRSILGDPASPNAYRNKWLSLREWRPAVAAPAATKGREIATAQIKKYKDSADIDAKIKLMEAYLAHAELVTENDSRKHYAREASTVYNSLPPECRDLHEHEEIEWLLRA